MLESVCSGRMTRSRSAKAQPAEKSASAIVNVHCTRGVKSPVLLWTGDFTPRVQWTLTIALALFSAGCAFALRERVIRPLQTLSNMLAAIREQDYSLRARRSSPEDALGLAMLELNSLMNELRERRLGALEATALLQRVMGEIDVAVLAFDDTGALRL